ncbi:lipid-A-disaccharide synthase [Leeia sp. TBRC 13508]|uniref:Lipid-A-disaccharide synthase n=1 Tax=Leeia speluncae TaxID=2884804 RepID=A0ABS8D5Y9_9NEIS|nr:lipid-A-disaccharide synthase [Leeia speluncae]MCB6183605.1 lipid-A-disaccharide synthase [Leeia speluncae]
MVDSRPFTIALVAGEASGDTLGAHLVSALKKHLPNARFVGIGGPKMIKEGMTSWWPQEKLAVMGYVEVLKHYREIVGIRKQLKARLLADAPDVFIGIDAPGFNLDLEIDLKRRGIKTIHYVSPSIWAWKAKRIHKIKRAVNHILALFPFEPELYKAEQIPVTYVGHPLADVFPIDPPKADIREQMKIGMSRPVFAMLPGSRQSELKQHASLFVKTAKLIAEQVPDALFLVPLMTRETREIFEKACFKEDCSAFEMNLMYGHAPEAMAAADVVLVASGTATLEAALMKRPMVITYKMSPITWWLMTRKMYLPYVGLPNILSKEFVVPEIMQKKATPQSLSVALLESFRNKDLQVSLKERFTNLHLLLKQNTAQKAAEAVLQVMGINR